MSEKFFKSQKETLTLKNTCSRSIHVEHNLYWKERLLVAKGQRQAFILATKTVVGI
jgi:hypothetical protein